MTKILGLDPGSNSIGWAIRDTSIDDNILGQLTHYGVSRYVQGVGKDKTGEFSYAAKRTGFRSIRRHYQSVKYRVWETLKVLIEYNLCPLTNEELSKWRKYDKDDEQKHKYPIDNKKFEQWVRLDFDNDGKPEYKTIYELRHFVATNQIDINNETDRYKLGRVFYSIAHKRGFKSSKLEAIKSDELKDSEKKASANLQKYIEDKKSQGIEFPTIGCVLHSIIQEGNRVVSKYSPIRADYEKEIKYIFYFQKSIKENKDLFHSIYKAIFYQRPLRSQKGLIGKCLLEKNKSRCPVSRPEFELFRAWSLINNIKYRKDKNSSWQELDLELKKELYNKKFIGRLKPNFEFKDITTFISLKVGFELSKDNGTINYREDTNVAACPITARFIEIFGDKWNEISITTNKKRIKSGEQKDISYSWEDIWNICFTSDDEDFIVNFAKTSLGFQDDKTEQFVKLWNSINQGYSKLSLKAIKNINRFLLKGLNYTNSVFLAKIPDIIGLEEWNKNEQRITEKLVNIQNIVAEQRIIYNIVNSLIANYKAKTLYNQFANKNYDYILEQSDFDDIEKECCEYFGANSWKEYEADNKNVLLSNIKKLYQEFFQNKSRTFYKLPNVEDELKKYIKDLFPALKIEDIEKLYHPSNIEFYPIPEKEKIVSSDGTLRYMRLLHSPKIGAFKNPMAMRMMYMLKKLINYLLKEGIIDDETRIVVELPRDINDANMRWALEAYDKIKEKRNSEIKNILKEYGISEDSATNIERLKIVLDNPYENNKDSEKKPERFFKKYFEKYKLTKEQNFQCIYTGKIITMKDLLSDNSSFDIEHTLPQSKTLNNSLANKTICDAYYNRNIKKNQIPTQLKNYDKDALGYTAILPRLKDWELKVKRLKSNVEYWKNASKIATTKDNKDKAIQQKHLWQMELDYWNEKLGNFKIKEITTGFTRRNLVDTRLISKYIVLYLKTCFNSVDIQKGKITSDFRHILGIQQDTIKDRTNYSHHAVDASTLTMIPLAAKRDKILSLYYEKEEKKHLGEKYSTVEQDLQKEIKSLNLGFYGNIEKEISDNILVNNFYKDKSLKKAKKIARVKGKIVVLPNGKKKILTGDSVRGELHQQSYYGAIAEPITKDGQILRDENNKIIISQDDSSKPILKYVIRKPLEYSNTADSIFKDWDSIEKAAVDKNIIKRLKENYKDMTFQQACENGELFYLDNKGNKRTIRHIRCYAQRIQNPVEVKKQLYIPENNTQKYKNYVYSAGGDVLCISKYSNGTKSEYIVSGLFDIAQNRKYVLDDIPKTILSKKKQIKLNLEYTLWKGTKVIVYDKNESISDIKDILNKRLYVFEYPERDGAINIILHSCADKNIKGESIKQYDNLPKHIRQRISKLNLYIENIDFKVTPAGEIIFLEK